MKKVLSIMCVVVAWVGVMASLMPAHSAPAATSFVVNDPLSDAVDTNPGNGQCQTVSATCTLRAAIMEANAQFAAVGGTYEISLTSAPVIHTLYLMSTGGSNENGAATGDYDIKSDVLLRGGSNRPIIDANQLDRVFQVVGAGNRVTLTNIIIQHGKADLGAGIYNSGTLTLDNVLVTNNVVTTSLATTARGGGIYNAPGASLTLNDSTVQSNSSVSHFSTGGGIASFGNLTLNGSAVVSNSLRSGSAMLGAGIFATGTATLNRSMVLTNTVNGGGLGTVAGAGMFNGGNATIDRSTFAVNSTVNNSPEGSGYAGGIWNSGRMLLSNSTVRFNSAMGAYGVDGSAGGLRNDNLMTVVSSLIYGNSASDGAGIQNGGSLTLTNSTLSTNFARGNGGGLYDSGSAHLLNDTVAINFADTDVNDVGDGGGIFVFGAGGVIVHHTLLTNNGDLSTASDVFRDCAGTLISEDYNLILDTTGCSIINLTAHNKTGAANDPSLDLTLKDNGGPTLTHALPANSKAVIFGDPAGCTDASGAPLLTDQRGFARVGSCDMGAFEVVLRVFLPLIGR